MSGGWLVLLMYDIAKLEGNGLFLLHEISLDGIALDFSVVPERSTCTEKKKWI